MLQIPARQHTKVSRRARVLQIQMTGLSRVHKARLTVHELRLMCAGRGNVVATKEPAGLHSERFRGLGRLNVLLLKGGKDCYIGGGSGCFAVRAQGSAGARRLVHSSPMTTANRGRDPQNFCMSRSDG